LRVQTRDIFWKDCATRKRPRNVSKKTKRISLHIAPQRGEERQRFRGTPHLRCKQFEAREQSESTAFVIDYWEMSIVTLTFMPHSSCMILKWRGTQTGVIQPVRSAIEMPPTRMSAHS